MASIWQAAASGGLALLVAARWDRAAFGRSLGYTLAFVGAVLVAALVILWLNRWRKRPVEEGTSAGDQLSHFRELYEQGELSAEEFARVRQLLGERLRKELQVPAAPPAPAPPEDPPAAGPAGP